MMKKTFITALSSFAFCISVYAQMPPSPTGEQTLNSIGNEISNFSSDLAQLEKEQKKQPDKVFKYVDQEHGVNLKKLLEPNRLEAVIKIYIENLKSEADNPLFLLQLALLINRYEQAFLQHGPLYEDEYLDTLNLHVLIARNNLIRVVRVIDYKPLSASEKHPALQRLIQAMIGSSDRVITLVKNGSFSERGARRALELAYALNPPGFGGYAEGVAPLFIASVTGVPQVRPVVSGEKVYKAQCFVCHDHGLASAPRFGDLSAWTPRIKAGFSAMVKSTLKGKGVMAPQGGGFYSDIEIERAVSYLANSAGGKFTEPSLPSKHTGTVTIMPVAKRKVELPYVELPYVYMTKEQKLAYGEQSYLNNCAACHQADGRANGKFPALVNAPSLGKVNSALQIVMAGNNAGMPGFLGVLPDEKIAEIVNYVRHKFFTQKADSIGPEDVRSFKKKWASRVNAEFPLASCEVEVMQDGEILPFKKVGNVRTYLMKSKEFRLQVQSTLCEPNVAQFTNREYFDFVAKNPVVTTQLGFAVAESPETFSDLPNPTEDPRRITEELVKDRDGYKQICTSFKRCPQLVGVDTSYWKFRAPASDEQFWNLTYAQFRRTFSKDPLDNFGGEVFLVVFTTLKKASPEYSLDFAAKKTHPLILKFTPAFSEPRNAWTDERQKAFAANCTEAIVLPARRSYAAAAESAKNPSPKPFPESEIRASVSPMCSCLAGRVAETSASQQEIDAKLFNQFFEEAMTGGRCKPAGILEQILLRRPYKR